MDELKDIFISPLTVGDAEELTELLSSSREEYSKHFIPFPFELQAIRNLLSSKKADRYFGVKLDDKLVGFYMLRGFDGGYKIPSYGVWISEEFSGKGLSKLTLQHAFSFCKINGIKKLMLKVAPENIPAKNIYESFGFTFSSVDDKIGHLIYFKEL
ncbi:MAG: GNAT family N-acetyltransferase [Ignavibacteriaceae bacterium]|nr:GNAT family N-acetyltransferase [Ignavibacteriaceae bacterium]